MWYEFRNFTVHLPFYEINNGKKQDKRRKIDFYKCIFAARTERILPFAKLGRQPKY